MGVDDLFSGRPDEGQLPDPTPRLGTAVSVAAILVILGPCCCTGPLGGMVALWAWARSGDAITRAELGLHAEPVRRRAGQLRQRAFGLMWLSALSLCAQSVLWGAGLYPWLYTGLLQLMGFDVAVPAPQ